MSEEHHSSQGERHASLGIRDLHLHEPGHGTNRALILRRAWMVVVLVAILLGLGAARAVVNKINQGRNLAGVTAEQMKTYVSVTSATRSDKGQQLVLPGTLQGFVEAPIYARSSGYVLRWHRDIGTRVSQGDLLAEIDAPELDQQLDQAVAARAQTSSSLELAKSSFERWQGLRERDAVSQQELEERRSAYTQAQANLAAADANVRRLHELELFKRVVAPFAGVVIRRNVNVGDLIDAGNSGSTSRALFVLAQTDPLRVYVYVPQSYSQQIKAGDEVTLSQTELPGQEFHGTVARTAGAIDIATRTMQVEISLPNRDGKLLPGAYAQVEFPSTIPNSLIVPTNTVMFRGEGPRIAVVGDDGRVALRAVTIGRDFGRTLEIVGGITEHDKLVLNPPDSLADGDAVSVVPSSEGEGRPVASAKS
jgi:RND family efflux transporter MFP subunit